MTQLESRSDSRIHDHLAEHLAPFQIFMSGADFAEREGMIDDRLEASGKDVPQYFMQFAHCAHVGTKHAKLTCEHMPQINSDAGAGRRAARDQSARSFETLHAFI